jgi:hypothetical protein
VGDLPDGKSFARVNAYGVGSKPADGSYHAWLQLQAGETIDLGQLEIDQNGSGFAMMTGLPGLDQAKSVSLTLDPAGAKQPGLVVAKADVPRLAPSGK